MAEHRQQFAKRLKEAMQAMGHSPQPSVLVNLFNLEHSGESVTFQTASRWLKGESLPTPERVKTLATLFASDACYLLFGERTRLSIRDTPASWPGDLPAQDGRMLKSYLRLPVAQRKLVRELILALADSAGA